MKLSQKTLARIAGDIHSQLRVLQIAVQRDVLRKCSGLIEQLEKLGAIQAKLQLCEERAWKAARRSVVQQMEILLRDVSYYTQDLEQVLEAPESDVLSLRNTYAELVQADEEFGTLAYHDEGHLLAVTTEAIELEGVYLGEFEIQLHVPSLAELRNRAVYRIFALDPHPATSNEAITHPHVSDERLCSGDGGAAINAALASGRICDFFLLVNSVLTHYNPHSPYVSLEHWDGTPCYDCGYVTGSDSLCWCSYCEHDFCEECTSYCRICEETTCLGCLEECSVCGDQVCQACLTECPDCDRSLCRSCVDDLVCGCLEEDTREDSKAAVARRDL